MPPENEYDDMDPKAIAAEIGGELFFANEAVDENITDIGDAAGAVAKETKPAVTEKPAAETPPPQESQEANPAIVQGQNSVARELPKSWRKEMAPAWAKLPPEVHEYVYEREANVMRGIQQYQSGHDSWNTLVKPFAPIFQQNPDVKPVELMQGLMNTHLQLCNPSLPPEKKAALAKRIFADYGISLDAQGEIAPDSAALQEIATLRQELAQIKSGLSAQEKARNDAEVERHVKIIDAFAKDPKNKYFDELGADINRFIQTGVAQTIEAAYDMACWSNPAVRAKILAEQQASQNPPPGLKRDGKGKFVNIEAEETPPPRSQRKGTIDATIDGIVNSHYSKH